jgi:hypothetical protein
MALTFPSAESERLILVASFRRSPVAPVFDWRSEPARSTRLSLPIARPSCPPMPLCSITIVKIECERDESAFISVAPTVRFWLPAVKTCWISCALLTT